MEGAKAAAVEQWTADPCGSDRVAGEPGTREYFEDLLRARQAYAPWMSEELDYAGAAGQDVLDVGCGQGIDVASYALAGANATGVDLTPRHVELATAHTAALGLDVRVVQGDAETLPFDDHSFDRASSNGVLHHTPDMLAALREMRRVVRPGGRATVIVYNRRSLHYWTLHVLMEGVLKGGLLRERSMSGVLSRGVEHSDVGARPLVNVYSPRELRSLLETAGFRGVLTSVRHYALSDSPLTGWMEGRVKRASDPALLDRIGRRAGWYVIGRGTA
jgi:ubiquinone/menaquinone biosynthesis C-methylase UbiE